jgi:hypothetical protein
MKNSRLFGLVLAVVCCGLVLGSAMYAPGGELAAPVPGETATIRVGVA